MARPRKSGVARTASGQISRAKIGPVHFVYLAYIPSEEMFKVGVTGDVRTRAERYRSRYRCEPVMIAEFAIIGRSDALSAEAMAIAAVEEAGFGRFKEEWFRAGLRDSPALVSIVGGAVGPLAQWSLVMGALTREPASTHKAVVLELTKNIRGHSPAMSLT